VDETAHQELAATISRWVDDPESDVVYAEKVEERWAIRMRQTVREATTVWWQAGDRSVTAEAYLIPPPELTLAAYRLALVRNMASFRVWFALDREGALVLRARIPIEPAAPERLERELELTLGEIYEKVEISFRPLLAAAFSAREKNP
jgi:hypothetical protein